MVLWILDLCFLIMGSANLLRVCLLKLRSNWRCDRKFFARLRIAFYRVEGRLGSSDFFSEILSNVSGALTSKVPAVC
jgi:hypothetical protein